MSITVTPHEYKVNWGCVKKISQRKILFNLALELFYYPHPTDDSRKQFSLFLTDKRERNASLLLLKRLMRQVLGHCLEKPQMTSGFIWPMLITRPNLNLQGLKFTVLISSFQISLSSFNITQFVCPHFFFYYYLALLSLGTFTQIFVNECGFTFLLLLFSHGSYKIFVKS